MLTRECDSVAPALFGWLCDNLIIEFEIDAFGVQRFQDCFDDRKTCDVLVSEDSNLIDSVVKTKKTPTNLECLWDQHLSHSCS